MESISLSLMDRSLIIGGLILVLTILGGLFHFFRMGLFSMGVEKHQAGIASGVIMLVGVIFIYRTFFI